MSRANREGLKVKELKSICKGLGIKGYSKYNKEGLIALINGERPPPPVRRRRVRHNVLDDEQQGEVSGEVSGEVYGEDHEDECPICMDHFTNKKTTSCRHSFCNNCITQWCKDHDNCPLCRKFIKNEFTRPRQQRPRQQRPPQPRIQRPQDFLRDFDLDFQFILQTIFQINQNNHHIPSNIRQDIQQSINDIHHILD